MSLLGVLEDELAAYLSGWKRQFQRRLYPFFRLTVSSVGGSPGAWLVRGVRTNEQQPDGMTYACTLPSYYPQAGDVVQCEWVDDTCGVVVAVISTVTAQSAIGWVKGAEVIVGVTSGVPAPAASIQLALPSGYRNAQVEWEARGDTGAFNTDLRAQANGDTGSNYDWEQFLQSGAGAAGAANGNGDTSARIGSLAAINAPSGYFSSGIVEIQNYVSTNILKRFATHGSLSIGSGAGSQYVTMHSGFWRPGVGQGMTALKIFPAAGNFVAGSIFTLYLKA